MRRIRLLAPAALLLAVLGWLAFRPERIVLDREVNEAPPVGAAPQRVLSSGTFRPRAHRGSGRAQVLDLGAGRRVLRLESLDTSDGPDLQVYLLATPDAEGRAGLAAGFVSLGALKGNVGTQHYEIPAGLALERYRAVAVWCRRFGVNFTTAELAAAIPSS